MCSLPPVQNEHPLPDISSPSDLSVCAPVTEENPEVPLHNRAVSFANEGISASVARVAYCQDATCSFADLSPHLSVEIDDVPLGPNNATAISYTWGEFHREKTSIGHMHGDASACVQMELGKEWVIRDFIDRLAELSKDAPIWIDQICIPQKEEAVRQVLVSIPAIFRTFDAVALMPGHPCKCLDDFLENRMPPILAAEDKTFAEKEKELNDFAEDGCLSSLAPSSWFKRIWTRQELMCSRQIRCVWASSQRAKCVSWNVPEKSDLERYMALYLEKLEGDGFSEKEIPIQLQNLQRWWHAGACFDFLTYLRLHIQTVPVIASVLRFLGGEILQNGRATADTTIKNAIGELSRELRWIGTWSSGPVLRRATHSSDYVVSVWIDCPGYTVPPGYKTMDAPELLNNAMAQLRHNYGLAFPTNAPRGLFEPENSGSALFDAVMYFSAVPIHHVANLYGPFSTDSSTVFAVDQTGAVPILLSARYPVALSHYAEEYMIFSERFGQGKSSTLIPFFQVVISLCSNICVTKFLHYRRTLYDLLMKDLDKTQYKGKHSHEEMLQLRVQVELLERLAYKNEMAQQSISQSMFCHSPSSDDIFDDLLETTLYDFIATSLSISCESCKAAGVAIMVDPGGHEVGRPPRIGFFRRDVDLRKLGRSQDLGEGFKRAITVCMNTVDRGPDYTSGQFGEAAQLFEAYQVEGRGFEDVPKYRVFGVWMPTAVTKSEEYGACLGSLEEGGADAFLI